MLAFRVNKTTKEDKILIVLIIIFFLLAGFYLIYSLMSSGTAEPDQSVYVEKRFNYELISESEKFKLYTLIDRDRNSNIVFNDGTTLDYRDSTVFINGNELARNVRLYDYVAFYDKTVLLLVSDLNDEYSALILFDLFSNTSTVIKEINGMSIVNLDYANISEAGINVHLASYKGKKLYINEKEYDLCTYKKNSVVYKNVMYFFDYPSLSFRDIDTIETKTVNQIKKDIC